MEIAARMIEKTPGITRLIDRLEDKMLVERERDVEDRRQVRVSITAAGLSLLEKLEEPVRSATEAAISTLNQGEVTQLRKLLARIRKE